MKTIIIALLLLIATTASAHVSVKPAQVGIASYQTFTVSVPVEKNIPTTAIRLVIPVGLESVTPYVKPGWKITSDGKELVWSGGSIPAGHRDDFLFSAKTPAVEATLVWKAYQTYADGTIVAWDAHPTSSHEEQMNPASQSKVINDLAMDHHGNPVGARNTLGWLSLAIALVALGFSLRKR